MKTEFNFTVPIYANVSKKKKILVNMNWYRNAHYMVSNNVKKLYKKIVHDVFKNRNVQLKGRIHISFSIYIKRRGSDGGNIRSVIEKFVLDALKDEGVIKDDTFEDIVSDNAAYFLDRINPRCDIIIKEIKDDND